MSKGQDEAKKASGYHSDNSDASGESLSLSQESNTEVAGVAAPKPQPIITQKRLNRRSSEWEIIEGLRDGQRYETKPEVYTGYLHKKRKWPLKGWHKRYFVVDSGILKYGKSPNDVSRGKIHGSVDIALSVISTKSKRKRIDIDAEEFIYHLKAKQNDAFESWVDQLKRHRLYRQHLLNFGDKNRDVHKLPLSRKLASDGSPPLRLQWVIDGPLQVAVTELNHTQQALTQLGRLLDQLEISTEETEGSSPTVKKDRRKFILRKKKSNKGSSVDLTKDDFVEHQQHLTVCSSGVDTTTASDFIVLAKDVYTSLKSITYTINTEKERYKGSPDDRVKYALMEALKQNTELRTRLGSISRTSDLADLPEPVNEIWDFQTRILHSSLSRNSCASEFYDAEEGDLPPYEIDTGATSDASSLAASSEENSSSSEASDMADSEYNVPQTNNYTGRRNKLPATSPDTQGLSLWQLLSKNIGKDLSQVSMPVGLSHPLSVLQRLCEDLEYSDLLDKASSCTDPVERMIYISAFAVSSYSSSYLRAGSKPFNPLLGETYESIREDRGFRYISEQVSHHPPISVCHAESKNYTFWQDIRIKTKFWGKSMEFQPSGNVYLELNKIDGTKEMYQWNKVTACVHNLFSETRWLEQYGTMIVQNQNYNCSINFIRASYFSPQRYELQGKITDLNSKKDVEKLFGKWNEALYIGDNVSAKCIWRPGTMPTDYQLYYGFTRFAIELNELQPDMINVLPCTDTRFRPDQRLLEEGKLDDAERVKLQLETAQRERRKKLETEGKEHEPRWFRKTVNKEKEEMWVYKGDYWEKRKNPGFVNINIDPIW